MHYSLFIKIQFSDTPRTSESDTDSSKTGIYTLFSIHHSSLKDTYTCYIYSGMEYLELPVKTPSLSPSPSPSPSTSFSTSTRHYRRGGTYNILYNYNYT